MRIRIDLFQGTELIRQFRDPLIATTNPPPKSVYCQVRAFGSFRTLLSQPCAHQPFHHPSNAPLGLSAEAGWEVWLARNRIQSALESANGPFGATAIAC